MARPGRERGPHEQTPRAPLPCQPAVKATGSGACVTPPGREGDAGFPRKEPHPPLNREEGRKPIDDSVSNQAKLTAQKSFDPPPSVVTMTSVPAMIDAAVQVHPSLLGYVSVSTSTSDLRVGSNSSDAATCTSEDGVLQTAVFRDMACNCLLYTSPSPRDGLLSRMPSSA